MAEQCRVRAIDDARATVDQVCDTSLLSLSCVFQQGQPEKKSKLESLQLPSYDRGIVIIIPIPASTQHFKNHAQRCVSARARGHVVGGDAATQKRRASAQDRVSGPTRAAGGGP
jgi:hypothetical protein